MGKLLVAICNNIGSESKIVKVDIDTGAIEMCSNGGYTPGLEKCVKDTAIVSYGTVYNKNYVKIGQDRYCTVVPQNSVISEFHKHNKRYIDSLKDRATNLDSDNAIVYTNITAKELIMINLAFRGFILIGNSSSLENVTGPNVRYDGVSLSADIESDSNRSKFIGMTRANRRVSVDIAQYIADIESGYMELYHKDYYDCHKHIISRKKGYIACNIGECMVYVTGEFIGDSVSNLVMKMCNKPYPLLKSIGDKKYLCGVYTEEKNIDAVKIPKGVQGVVGGYIDKPIRISDSLVGVQKTVKDIWVDREISDINEVIDSKIKTDNRGSIMLDFEPSDWVLERAIMSMFMQALEQYTALKVGNREYYSLEGVTLGVKGKYLDDRLYDIIEKGATLMCGMTGNDINAQEVKSEVGNLLMVKLVEIK